MGGCDCRGPLLSELLRKAGHLLSAKLNASVGAVPSLCFVFDLLERDGMSSKRFDVDFSSGTVQGVSFSDKITDRSEEIVELETQDIGGVLALDSQSALTHGVSSKGRTTTFPVGQDAFRVSNSVMVVPRLIEATKERGSICFRLRCSSSDGFCKPWGESSTCSLVQTEESFGGYTLGKVAVSGKERMVAHLSMESHVQHDAQRHGGAIYPQAFLFNKSSFRIFLDGQLPPSESTVDIFLRKMSSTGVAEPYDRPVHAMIRFSVSKNGISLAAVSTVSCRIPE